MFPEHAYIWMSDIHTPGILQAKRAYANLAGQSQCATRTRKKEREGASGSESPQLSVDRTADWPHLQCQFPLICRATAVAAAAAAVHLPLHLCRKYVKILFAFFCFPFLVHFLPPSHSLSISPAVFARTCCGAAN